MSPSSSEAVAVVMDQQISGHDKLQLLSFLEEKLSLACSEVVRQRPENPLCFLASLLESYEMPLPLAQAHNTRRQWQLSTCKLQEQLDNANKGAVVGTVGRGSEVDHSASTNSLRVFLVQAFSAAAETQETLIRLTPTAPATSRARFLLSLNELVGPPPLRRTWRDDWVPLRIEYLKLTGQGRLASEVSVRASAPLEKKIRQWGGDIDALVARGWPRESAETYRVLSTVSNALGRALRGRDPAYNAAIYAVNEVLYAQQQPAEHLPKLMYAPRRGAWSLSTEEPQWEQLEVPDRTGFRGVTSSTITQAAREPQNFSEAGFCVKYTNTNGDIEWNPQDTDIICFESIPDDQWAGHSAILLNSDEHCAFPLNTLFRLKEVLQPGTWEAPGGSFPMQRLFVVTASYKAPFSDITNHGLGVSKVCTPTASLSYGNRNAFVDGIDDMIAKPVLSMHEECMQPHEWKDWKGATYTLAEEWAYVNGPAHASVGHTAGNRDIANDGKTPHDFLEMINLFIERRRAEGHGALLPESHAFLTLDEVLAVRLYSGPGYQPINDFLRQVSRLTGEFRTQVLCHPRLTLCATIGHICRAIRKLSAVTTPQEANEHLYRGVRGELERTFWVPDQMDMICAVDMAFMSTSRNQQTPIDYMGGGNHNVLWKLETRQESDTGFHRGANIEMLSQYAAEQEVLFPPCTMLTVLTRPATSKKTPLEQVMAEDVKAAAGTGEPEQTTVPKKAPISISALVQSLSASGPKELCIGREHVEGKSFMCISVLPTFL